MELIAVINWWPSFLKGVIYSTKTHAEPPFKPQPFTLAEQPDFMLSLGVSEFTLNSASYAYYSAGLLQILINESMVRGVTHTMQNIWDYLRLTDAMSPTQIPSFSPVHLNTSSVGAFIPQVSLVTTYHINAFMSVRIWILINMINQTPTALLFTNELSYCLISRPQNSLFSEKTNKHDNW